MKREQSWFQEGLSIADCMEIGLTRFGIDCLTPTCRRVSELTFDGTRLPMSFRFEQIKYLSLVCTECKDENFMLVRSPESLA